LQEFSNTICGRHPIAVLLHVRIRNAWSIFLSLIPTFVGCVLYQICWPELATEICPVFSVKPMQEYGW
jgi:hypothetical protein